MMEDRNIHVTLNPLEEGWDKYVHRGKSGLHRGRYKADWLEEVTQGLNPDL